MLEQIKELVADKLGADAEAITEKTSFKEDLEQIPWTFSNW